MKYKNRILAILLAAIVVAVALIAVFALPAILNVQNSNWLSGWSYRKSHNITQSAGAGFDYQIKITTYYQAGLDSEGDVYLNSKCKTDFDDIRFTDDDGKTVLAYWMETKVDGSNAVFWVKVNDNLDFDQSIYVYYGNNGALSASNIEATFPVADDFSGSTLDAAKWEKIGSGNVSVIDGNCKLEAEWGADGWAYILGKEMVGTNYAARFRTMVYEQKFCRWTHHGFADNSTIFYKKIEEGIDQGNVVLDDLPNFISMSQETWDYAWSWRTKADNATIRVDRSSFAPASQTYYTYEIQRNAATEVKFCRNDIYEGTIDSNVPTADMRLLFAVDNAGQNMNSITVIDWAFIRKYVANEPLNSLWGSEETAPTWHF